MKSLRLFAISTFTIVALLLTAPVALSKLQFLRWPHAQSGIQDCVQLQWPTAAIVSPFQRRVEGDTFAANDRLFEKNGNTFNSMRSALLFV